MSRVLEGETDGERSVSEAAHAFLAAGFSVLPVKQDGTKAPAVQKWKKLQTASAKAEQIEGWFSDGRRTGLGLVTGYGSLECLEFESADAWEAYRKAATAVGLAPLLERVADGYSERSPGGGVHLLYRCKTVAGNTLLAAHPALPKQTLIETRGDGGFVIVAPSHGTVHETGRPYELLAGGPETVETITCKQRRNLFDLARSFDRRPVRPPQEAATHVVNGARPGDNYNRRGPAWPELLEPVGWVALYERDGTTYWRRPGKTHGVSATTNHAGSDLLWVFSTSADPFEAERSYDRFGAYALLEHEGDFAEAAKALADDGYDVELWPRRTGADLALPVPSVKFLVRGFWVEGSYGTLAGEEKTLKSYFLCALAVAVAAGVSFLGHFPVDRQGPVLLIVGEGGRIPLQRRMQRIAQAYGVDLAALPIEVIEHVAPLDSRPFTLNVEAAIEEMRPVLVGLDPLYAYHPTGVDPRNLYERGPMLAALTDMVAARGAAFILNDNFNKTGTGTGLARIAQAGMKEWVDSWVLLSHADEPDVAGGKFRLFAEIGSRHWGGSTYSITFEVGEFDSETGEHTGPISWSVAQCDGSTASARRDMRVEQSKDRDAIAVLRAIDDEPWELTHSQLVKVVGGRAERVREVIASLETERVVVAKGDLARNRAKQDQLRLLDLSTAGTRTP